MYETAAELADLQALLDASVAGATEHLRSIVVPGRRTLTARDVAAELADVVCVLNVATVSARGEPRLSAVDGHFLHGRFYFTTVASAAKVTHLRARPAISVGYTPRDGLGVWVHGSATFLDEHSAQWAQLDEHAALMYGSSPTTFGDEVEFVRVDPAWMVGFAMSVDEQHDMQEALAARTQRLARREVPR